MGARLAEGQSQEGFLEEVACVVIGLLAVVGSGAQPLQPWCHLAVEGAMGFWGHSRCVGGSLCTPGLCLCLAKPRQALRRDVGWSGGWVVRAEAGPGGEAPLGLPGPSPLAGVPCVVSASLWPHPPQPCCQAPGPFRLLDSAQGVPGGPLGRGWWSLMAGCTPTLVSQRAVGRPLPVLVAFLLPSVRPGQTGEGC